MLKKWLDPSRKAQKSLGQFADQVLAIETKYASFTDADFKKETETFKTRITQGETLEDIEVEAFALVREASKRVTGMTPFKVQVMGAHVIHQGNIAEMKTGVIILGHPLNQKIIYPMFMERIGRLQLKPMIEFFI